MTSIDLARVKPFRLGNLEVRPATREAVAGVSRLTLEPRIMQVLVALARRRGEVVSRADLIEECWGGRTVVDEAVNRCIHAVRRLAATHGGFSVTTVPRVGYRLDERPTSGESHSGAGAQGAAQAAPDLPLLRRAPLVGRDNELRQLRRFLAQTLEGRGSMVLLAGDAGVGKTRLAEEIGAEAARGGALFVTGHCYEGSADTTYTPFVDLLEQTARRVTPGRFREWLGEDAAQIATIFPELRKRFDDVPPPAELPVAQQQRYLFSSLLACLERAAQVQPLVFVLEDLHWGDEATLALTRYLAERVVDIPILLVGTHRDVERETSRPFRDFLEEALRRRLGSRLRLRGLDQEDTAALVRALTGREFARSRIAGPDDSIEQVGNIHRATRGNPFLIEETIKHLADEGRLIDADGYIRTGIVIDDIGVSEGVRLVVGKRVARLGEGAGSVLAAAAIIGPRFAVELLQALDLVRPEAVADALGEADAAGFIAAESEGYRFSHDLIRQTLLADMAPQHRQHLHLRIAEATERLYPGELPQRVAEIADHLLAAGTLPDASKGRYLLSAGIRAQRAADFERALRYFEGGLTDAGTTGHLERAHFLYGRARCCRSLGRSADAEHSFREALAIYEQIGDVDRALKVCFALSEDLSWSERTAESTEVCERALAILGPRSCAERVRLLGLIGWNAIKEGRQHAGEALLSEVGEVARELGDPTSAATVAQYRMLYSQRFGDLREMAAFGVAAARLHLSLGDRRPAAYSLLVAIEGLFAQALWDDAEQLLKEAEPIADQAGRPDVTMHLQLYREGISSRRNGTFLDDRDRAWLRALTKRPSARAHALLALGVNDFFRGRWADAVAHFDEIAHGSADREVGEGQRLVMRARMGDRASVEPVLAQWSPDLLRERDEPRLLRPELGRLGAITEALHLLGRHEEAGRFYPLLLESFESGGAKVGRRVVAMAAASAGKWEEADSHFRAALDLAERLPDRFEQNDLELAWGEALLRRPGAVHRTRALELLASAAERYEKMGMRGHLQVAQRLIATHGLDCATN